MDNNRIEDFVIKGPRWTFYFALVGALTFLVAAVTIILLYSLGVCAFLPFIISISIAAVFFVVFAFCLYSYSKEKFVFKDGVFTLVKAIGKPQSVKIDSLSCVNIYPCGYVKSKNWSYVQMGYGRNRGSIKVEMIDKNNIIALQFTYYGTVFGTDLFGNVLVQSNICVKEFLKGEKQ